MNIFAQRLKQLREKRGLSQRELAKQINMAHSTLGMYEIGEREPDFNTVSKLSSFFNTSVDYLLGRTDDSRPIEEIVEEAKNSPEIQAAHRCTEELLAGNPDAEELLAFWKEMKEREGLFLLFKQVRPLSDDSIRRIIRAIKAIE